MELFACAPDRDLALMGTAPDPSPTHLRGLAGVAQEFSEHASPTWRASTGDTSTAFASALAAFYEQDPRWHWRRGCAPTTCSHPLSPKRPTGA